MGPGCHSVVKSGFRRFCHFDVEDMIIFGRQNLRDEKPCCRGFSGHILVFISIVN